MNKTVDAVVSFFYSFFNLFLAWVIVRSIGTSWDIHFLKPEVLTFKMYWGTSFALAIMFLPAMMSLASRYKEVSKGERLPTIVVYMMASFLMCIMWVIQLVISTVLF